MRPASIPFARWDGNYPDDVLAKESVEIRDDFKVGGGDWDVLSVSLCLRGFLFFMIFLMQSPHGWRGVWQRPHHLASRFAARGHYVRWVEPRYVKWLAGERERFWRARNEKPDERIEVAPVTLLNGERFGPIRKFNLSRLASALNRHLPSSANGKGVLWLYDPHQAELARLVPHDLLIYDIMDEYRGFPWSPPKIAEEEARLLAEADWVFAGTQALFDAKKLQAQGKIECLLSGVDAGHFREIRGTGTRTNPREPVPEFPMREKYRRLIGYAGMIDLRLDQELIADSARRHPDWGWILLGPTACDVTRLRAAPNVHLLGQKSYGELPAFYHSWDCAMIPFVENELTRHVNPTKMLEYAAAGLPVVARALPDIEQFYAEGAFLYRDAADCETQLKAILEGEAQPMESPLVREKLTQSAQWIKDRDWDAIAEKMLRRAEEIGKS